MTPDDVGRSVEEDGLKPRARQNVLLGLGCFIGCLGPAKVCALKRGDVDGRSWKLFLARELKAAGHMSIRTRLFGEEQVVTLGGVQGFNSASPSRDCERPMMNSELVAELADDAQLKTAIRELRKLRKESEPLDRAWSNTWVARQRYEREYAFAVKQLREREDRIMDELRPYLAKIEALEKLVRRLDRKIRKAQFGSKNQAARADELPLCCPSEKRPPRVKDEQQRGPDDARRGAAAGRGNRWPPRGSTGTDWSHVADPVAKDKDRN